MADSFLTVAVANDVNGFEMGVMTDHTPYMTGRAVSQLCGAAVSTIINQKDEWAAGKRSNRFAQKLLAKGFTGDAICFPVKHKGRDALAYPEVVVMTFLDYYAFESPNPNEVAKQNFRMLAFAGFRIFVYSSLGYDPTKVVPQQWSEFHARLLLVTAPVGYFGVFMETSALVLNALRAGLDPTSATIPDISIGIAWGKYWEKNELRKRFGERVRFEHNYPPSYPQSASNPQHPWVYPGDALGEFRRWLQGEYCVKQFPNYLNSKVSQGLLPPSAAQLLIAQSAPVELPASE